MKKNKNNSDKIITLRKLIIIISLVWIISVILIWYLFKDWTKSASFGDTFGAINSLFSGLALAGIIYTIYLQKTELSLQRKELKYTRNELKRTAIAQEDTANSMSTQIRLANYPFLEFDLGIKIFSFISESDYPHSKFIAKNLSDRFKEKIINLPLVDGVLWSISDVGYYPNLSKGKKIIIPIKFPVEDGSYSLFIQYRDILGNNYSNLIHFTIFEDYETIDEKPFSGIRIKPDYPIVTERINLYGEKDKKQDLPKYINEFIEYDKSSISLSKMKKSNLRSNDFKWKVE